MVLPGSCTEACRACGMGHGQVSPPKKTGATGLGGGEGGNRGLDGAVRGQRYRSGVRGDGWHAGVHPSVRLSSPSSLSPGK